MFSPTSHVHSNGRGSQVVNCYSAAPLSGSFAFYTIGKRSSTSMQLQFSVPMVMYVQEGDSNQYHISKHS